MSIAVFVPESAQELQRYRWAALTGSMLGPVQSGLAGVPPGADAVSIAPANAVRLTAAKLPAKNRRRLTQLAFAVEDGLAADAAGLHAVAGDELGEGNGQYAVALCERDWMEAALTAVRGAGLNPMTMRVETLLPTLDAAGWTAVWNGAGGFVRTGPASGFGFDADADGGAPLSLRLAMSEAKFAPKRIVLRAPMGVQLPDVTAWSVALGVPVDAGLPWPGLEAGWQNASGGGGIDLMSGEFAPSGRMGALPAVLRGLRPALIALALIVAAQVLLTGIEWGKLKTEQRGLQAQMVRDFKSAFPDAQQIIDPALQMRRSLADLRGAAGVADDADFLALAARAAPALAGTRIKLIKYDKGRLEVDTVYVSPQALEQARRMLGTTNIQSRAGPAGIDAHIVLDAGNA